MTRLFIEQPLALPGSAKKENILGTKGLQRQRLIGSPLAGFHHAKTITKAFATDLHARQDDYNKGI